MIDTYEPALLGGNERNVERLGVYVAWLISNNLLNPVLERQAGSAAARVKMQDLNGAEFLMTVLHGDLKPEHLSDEGKAFTETYFMSGDFTRDYQNCKYQGENEWHRYDDIAPFITAAYQQHKNPPAPRRSAKVIAFPGRRK